MRKVNLQAYEPDGVAKAWLELDDAGKVCRLYMVPVPGAEFVRVELHFLGQGLNELLPDLKAQDERTPA
jgi:hypothetical protein